MDDFAEILRLGIRLGERKFEKLAGLVFHGAAVARGAKAQALLGRLGKLTNCNAGHAINDSTDGNDCAVGFRLPAAGCRMDNIGDPSLSFAAPEARGVTPLGQPARRRRYFDEF
jgi:hypothetical protein